MLGKQATPRIARHRFVPKAVHELRNQRGGVDAGVQRLDFSQPRSLDTDAVLAPELPSDGLAANDGGDLLAEPLFDHRPPWQ